MAMQVTLTGMRPALEGQQFAFAGEDEVVIGRSWRCSLRLDDPKVSRRHCLLDVGGEWAWVRDLGSLNGTFVNGQDIGRHLRRAETDEPVVGGFKRLHDGDELRLGGHTFRVAVRATDSSEGERMGEPSAGQGSRGGNPGDLARSRAGPEPAPAAAPPAGHLDSGRNGCRGVSARPEDRLAHLPR
jgi:pSer/pThr/pTyr-binding forkhead associated (FHA) protein